MVDDNGLLPLRIQRRDEILKHFDHHKTIDRTVNQIRRKGIIALEETQRLETLTARRFQLDGRPFLLPAIGDVGHQREEGGIKVIHVDGPVLF